MSAAGSAQLVEDALRKLVSLTPTPPGGDLPVDMLVMHAEVVADERRTVFVELAALTTAGAPITDIARALLADLKRRDAAWRERLDDARERMLAERDRATAPSGRTSAYR